MRRRGESAAMVSEAEIVRHLISVLEKADFNTTTTTAIRKQLEIELGVDLSEKKALIRQQVDLYLAQQQQQQFGSNEAEQGEQYQEEEDGNRREEGEEEEQEGIDDEEVDVEFEGVEDVKSHVLAAGVSHGTEEVDSKRTRAKIDRAIKERYTTSFGNPNFCIWAALIGCFVQLIRELCELEEHGVKDRGKRGGAWMFFCVPGCVPNC